MPYRKTEEMKRGGPHPDVHVRVRDGASHNERLKRCAPRYRSGARPTAHFCFAGAAQKRRLVAGRCETFLLTFLGTYVLLHRRINNGQSTFS